MKTNLEQKDIEILNEFLEISKKILIIYKNLINLELNNKKNSNDFKEQLNYLEICLELEEDLYKKVDFNKIYSYTEYSDRGNLFKNFSDYDILINDFSDLIFAKRVYNRLNKIATDKLINTYQDAKIKKMDYPPFDLTTSLVTYIHNDIQKSLIFLIDNSLKDNINSKYKNELVNVKYLISFLNNDIEKDLQESIEINNYLIIRYLSTANNKDIENICNNLLHKYYTKYIKLHINDLSHIKDNDYQDDFQKVRSILLELIIRAFLDITPSTFNESNSYDVVKTIEEMIKLNKKNEISSNILKKILKDIKVKDSDHSLFRSERLV